MKDYLFRKNLSVKQLAGDLDISTSYLYQLIRGERKPSIELAQKIEDYTNGEVTLAALLGIDEEGGIKVISPSFESEANEHEKRFSSLEIASERFEGKLEEIEGRLLRLEKGE
ncbi:MAG: helix-turn-helix transcriptional regulator [Simkaniaceae bacterium]|jgi:transcriptional regulator with XRE-family HTH domain|nr:MAG: helix-turn-helix transcriptional regulator [Simkaniaceae bacterium]